MFYERFEELCRKNGYTPSGACIAMGRSKNLAAKWKHEGGEPSTKVLNEIATFFGVSADYLLGIEEKEKPATESGGNENLTDRQRELIRLIPRLTDQEASLLLAQVKGIILGQ